MIEQLEEVKARANVTVLVMRVLGPEFEQCGEELARRVMGHAREFHASFPAAGLQCAEDYQRHMDSVAAAGVKAIFAGVNSTLKLLESLVEDARRRGN